ncbi:response regulator transcription factor [Niveispirillum sp. BGYR6]|uniref:response regulator transcription factor n=1 Tax=Niveispirillum sp. BGYR6 TaxID=2971249 RepID=UPI0022B9C0FB|nr:response regulator transcription factor [Niveispirillum sp. BGYR6]MDG5493476.1 response regulator transcription factor [Niveispirillum sp. BGYR6]
MRILLIDHEAGFCQRVRQIARRAGVTDRVDEVADLAEARALAGLQPDAHVVVLSMTMVSRGAIRDFVAVCPALPLIAVGGNDPERMRAALGEGARAYVRRTDVDAELANALQVVADGGIFVPPVVAMRPGGEPLMTVAGPVPAGFFREDAGKQLTPRQREILVMIRQGRSNIEIAEALDLTVGTVKIHITAIFKALGVRNRTQAMVAADWLNLNPPEPVGD